MRTIFGGFVLVVCMAVFGAMAAATLILRACNAGLAWLGEHCEDLDE